MSLRKDLSGKHRLGRTEQYTKGGWAGIGGLGVKFIEGDGENFDWGMDHMRCLIYKFMCDQDAKRICSIHVPIRYRPK